MNTLIIYDSKRGGTKEIAALIAAQIKEETELLSLDTFDKNKLIHCEQVIFGAPAYAGMLRKEAKEFLAAHQDTLLTKPLFLFNTGLQFDTDKIAHQLKEVFPETLKSHAIVTIFAGSILNYSQFNFFEKIVLKKVLSANQIKLSTQEPYKEIKEDQIQKLVEAVNQD